MCIAVGVPLGIVAAHKPWFYTGLRPVLDLMQTVPTFVYLIPTLTLFGLGVVPGLISTVVFAVAAPIRLTCLGIQDVPAELMDAGKAFGCSRWQLLTRIEFDLLDTFTAEPRVAFSRAQLLERVWGPNWFGDDHLVDVHVSNLRRKLADDPRDPDFVCTVRGVGYRMGPGR